MTENSCSERWRCLCAYDGTDFNGWQKQPDGQSVQDKIEQALKTVFRRSVRTIGAGRTDAGVHAREQVFHFDAHWVHTPEALLHSLRRSLPEAISPRRIERVGSKFHALLSARGKRYRYRVCKGWALPEFDRVCHSMRDRGMNLGAMREASKRFIGTHDFSSFSANRRCGDQESPVKTVWRADWIDKGRELHLVVEGGGFLYKMVRGMTGAMLDVGLGKIEPEEIGEILASCKRTARVVSAPAKGLHLEKVFYRLPGRAIGADLR